MGDDNQNLNDTTQTNQSSSGEKIEKAGNATAGAVKKGKFLAKVIKSLKGLGALGVAGIVIIVVIIALIVIVGIVYNIIADNLVNSQFMKLINMSLVSFGDMFNSIIITYMLLGIGIGAFGSIISMRKYLKV